MKAGDRAIVVQAFVSMSNGSGVEALLEVLKTLVVPVRRFCAPIAAVDVLPVMKMREKFLRYLQRLQ
jgi:hypothetical protein